MCLYDCLQGVPRVPVFGELLFGPGNGEVTLQIKTLASGVNNSAHGFHFLIAPVLDGDILRVFVPKLSEWNV